MRRSRSRRSSGPRGVCPSSLDLRFVPADVAPPHAPSSVATELPSKFAGPGMLRSASRHTKVKCTWDEAPVQRRKDLMKKRFTPQEMAEMDLQAYLASSSDEEKEGAGDLKALVAGSDSESLHPSEDSDMEGLKKSKNEGDMEATFSVKASALEDKLAERAKQEGHGVHTLQQQPQSAWEKYLEKKKQKKRERKQQAREDREKLKKMKNDDATLPPEETEDLDLLMDDQKAERGFNFRGPQRKAHDQGPNPDDLDHFKMNVNDRRISKVFNHADFEIDPTNPEFRKSEGMLEVLKEKRKRKARPSPAAASAVAKAEPKTEAHIATAVTSSTAGPAGLRIFASQKRSKTTRSASPGGRGSAPEPMSRKRKKKAAK